MGKNNFHADTRNCSIHRSMVTLAGGDGGGVEVWSNAHSHLSSAVIERSFQVMGWEIGDDSGSIMALT